MDYTPADIELIVRNRLPGRTRQHPRPHPVRRRAQLAQQLRRAADRLEGDRPDN